MWHYGSWIIIIIWTTRCRGNWITSLGLLWETVIHKGFLVFSLGRNLVRKLTAGHITLSFGNTRRGCPTRATSFPLGGATNLHTSGVAPLSSLLATPPCSCFLLVVMSLSLHPPSLGATAEPPHHGATALPPRVGATTLHPHLVTTTRDPLGTMTSWSTAVAAPSPRFFLWSLSLLPNSNGGGEHHPGKSWGFNLPQKSALEVLFSGLVSRCSQSKPYCKTIWRLYLFLT